MTTETMQITLSHQPADARWGEKALLSTNNDGITIHLTGNGKLGAIQRAARKIDGQGIRQVTLAGEGWGLEQSWRSGRGSAGRRASAALNGRSCPLTTARSWTAA
ncbi:Peptidase B [Serratia rubidaea]|uniref:Peptidase B n=1 Tax=Serratia rubidaea TaxID=61652 RepID=A0A447QHN6_SERRU|nr:Peptidase B [Serratia rubidaea]